MSPTVKVAPGEEKVLYAEFYAGPKTQDHLEAISPGLNMTVDYGWLWFISQPIFALLVFLQSGEVSIFGMDIDIGGGVSNWGVAIILLTFIIKAIFFKLSATSYRSMAKMRKVAPISMPKMDTSPLCRNTSRAKIGWEINHSQP